MANLKILRLRIRSVSNTRQITKAMKMVAAAKLRRAQERALASRAYSSRMGRMLETMANSTEPNENASPLLYGRTNDVRRIELLVLTADRGLCGAFNSIVIRSVRARVAELEAAGIQVSLSFIGRKAHDVLKRQFKDQIRAVYRQATSEFSLGNTREHVAIDLLKAYQEGLFDQCFLVYNTFVSAMTQELTWRQVVPIPLIPDREQAGGGSYFFEPDEDSLLDQMLAHNVAVQIYQAIVESDASEHGSRMTAMDNAVRNAGEMINKLTITFNRTRQAAITTELMEIIGGAESLKG